MSDPRSWPAPTCFLLVLVLGAACSAPGQEELPPSERPAPVTPPPQEPRPAANRLARETSPYLLQHAHNPVDWYPWGEEAFAAARERGKPIFLSIGYAACHWCHVMERESFEDQATADLMNASFVCVKVDREERPDVDEVYMRAVMSMGQHGGWPLSVWLTPSGEPFYGGTYFPPEERHGMPSFRRVLEHISKLWETRRTELEEDASKLAQHLRAGLAGSAGTWPENARADAVRALAAGFDARWGGFGGAPKFPRPTELLLLWAAAGNGDEQARDMAAATLTHMADGGIHDQIGGGFHRYSVDERWLVPHFEKMLYDNALLVRAYLAGWRATGEERFEQVARSTVEYLLREMREGEGGFHSSTDADSEGEEGSFFVWTPEQLREVLGDADAELFASVYGVTPRGNFEHGTSILHLERPLAERAAERSLEPAQLEARLAPLRTKLYEHRAVRVPPPKDDKVLADWNGLAIAALAEGFLVLGEERWLHAAQQAAEFVQVELRAREDGFLRSWRAGEARHTALLADHAFLLEALVLLFEANPERRWLERAIDLGDRLVSRFADEQAGGFFTTPHDGERLIARFKGEHDGATPSASGIASLGLARLYQLTGTERYRETAERALALAAADVRSLPHVHASYILAQEWLTPAATTVVVSTGSGREELLRVARAEARRQVGRPLLVIDAPDGGVEAFPELASLLEGKGPDGEGRARVFVCRGFTCEAPTIDPEDLARQLGAR